MVSIDKTLNTQSDHADDRFEAASFFSVWERRTRLWALTCSVLTFLVLSPVVLVSFQSGQDKGFMLGLAITGLVIGVYTWQTKKIRRRRQILLKPFPAEWEMVLQRDVVFFRVLDPEAKKRFRIHTKVFLAEKRITGIGVQVDTTTRVLVAASAIIPILGFPNWEWDQISEVLVYPTRFDRDFKFGNEQGKNILGMVGTGSLNRIMILSKPDLVSGFRNANDKRNVGIHEFAHLVDKTDGFIDGMPKVGLDRKAIGPWIDLVRRKMSEIESGDSDINPYALTNEAEFFAVASEYFFERPALMQRKHPLLYRSLEKIFNQNLFSRAASLKRELTKGYPKFGRNSPCPCGSGRKFKKCCLQ